MTSKNPFTINHPYLELILDDASLFWACLTHKSTEKYSIYAISVSQNPAAQQQTFHSLTLPFWVSLFGAPGGEITTKI